MARFEIEILKLSELVANTIEIRKENVCGRTR